MYQKCTSNSYIYTKNVQTKNGLKLEVYVFCICILMYKPYKTYRASELKQLLYEHIHNVQNTQNF